MAPSLETFLNSFQNRLEKPVRQHLKNVYGTVTLTCASAGVGVLIDRYTWFQAGFLSTIVGIGLLWALMATPYNGRNNVKRLGYLLGFGLTTGMSLGIFLAYANYVDPSIVMTALLGTTFVFVCFSVSAMLADRGSFLYLGGVLSTLLLTMSVSSLANLFFNSSVLFQAHLYLGLIVMCGFVLFDTQMIIEKCRMGNRDYIQHALELFIDFVKIFRNLLIILTQKEERERRRKRE